MCRYLIIETALYSHAGSFPLVARGESVRGRTATGKLTLSKASKGEYGAVFM